MQELMNKRRNQKGFTLAELLIVVAIIAVLVAIAIPIFTTQLEKSREATDKANIRSAYAKASAALLDDEESDYTTDVDAKQTQPGWQSGTPDIGGIKTVSASSLDGWTVAIVHDDTKGDYVDITEK